jgi:hypothetical protein
MTAEKIHAGVKLALADFAARGWDAQNCSGGNICLNVPKFGISSPCCSRLPDSDVRLGHGIFENGPAASDSAWGFESIFVDSQTLDFRVERARWQT